MVALKARDVENFVAKPDFSYCVFFLYGPDTGLVSERAGLIAKKSGVDLADPFSLIRLSADEAASDPLRLADEANTIGMFGGKRLIRISGQTRRDLFKGLKPVLDSPPQDAWIIVEAGNLDTRSALRRNLEKHKACAAIPCYQDNVAALEKLISEEIISSGFVLDHDARDELRTLLGENRLLSRNELRKLALYSEGNKHITIEMVRAMVGDGSAMALSEVSDAAATGKSADLQTLVPKALQSGNRPDMILQSCLKHFQMLQMLRHRMDAERQPASNLIATVRPPLHFSRKESVNSALGIWPAKNIARALKRLDLMMLEARRNANAAASIAGTTLLALALEAETLKRGKR